MKKVIILKVNTKKKTAHLERKSPKEVRSLASNATQHRFGNMILFTNASCPEKWWAAPTTEQDVEKFFDAENDGKLQALANVIWLDWRTKQPTTLPHKFADAYQHALRKMDDGYGATVGTQWYHYLTNPKHPLKP